MQYITRIFSTMLLAMGVLTASSQEEMVLYDAEVPNSIPFAMEEVHTTDDNGITRVTGVTTPMLTAYFPAEDVTNTGKAVIICPGGGYAILAITHEGHDVAKLLAANGISAFVLKYRLPKDEIMVDRKSTRLNSSH